MIGFSNFICIISALQIYWKEWDIVKSLYLNLSLVCYVYVELYLSKECMSEYHAIFYCHF